jgi:hypothetical protein
MGNNDCYGDRIWRGKNFSYHSTRIIELAESKSAKVYALRRAERRTTLFRLEILAEATAMLAFIAFIFSTASCFTLAQGVPHKILPEFHRINVSNDGA